MTGLIDSARDCKLLYSNPVQSESAIILLRSKLLAVAQRLGFPEMRRENMALVMSEMVTNQIKHAGGRGMIQIWQQPGPTLDIFALDFGPGIPNLSQAQEDGFSSVNTLGKGLGSIQRLADEAYVYTQAEGAGVSKRWTGCGFLARFRLRHPRPAHADVPPSIRAEVGLFSRSLADERYNGDRIYLLAGSDALRWLHLDGLGHGEQAQKSTSNLSIHLSPDAAPEHILAAVDQQLQATRGAVGVVGEIDYPARTVTLFGVGDMHAHVAVNGDTQNVAFAPGVLGREHKSPTAFLAQFERRALVITASDGIRRNWDHANFPGLFSQHSQLIAYMVGNIMGRISDDQSLCVASFG